MLWIREPPTSYRSLSGPKSPKELKTVPGPPKSQKKTIFKESQKHVFKTCPDVLDIFETFSRPFWGPGGGPVKLFSDFFRDFGPRGPKKLLSLFGGVLPFGPFLPLTGRESWKQLTARPRLSNPTFQLKTSEGLSQAQEES